MVNCQFGKFFLFQTCSVIFRYLPTACVCCVAGQVTNVVRSCLQSSLALKQASGHPRRDAIGVNSLRDFFFPKKNGPRTFGGWWWMRERRFCRIFQNVGTWKVEKGFGKCVFVWMVRSVCFRIPSDYCNLLRPMGCDEAVNFCLFPFLAACISLVVRKTFHRIGSCLNWYLIHEQQQNIVLRTNKTIP